MKIPVVSQRNTSHLSLSKSQTSSPKHNNGKHNQGHQITSVHAIHPDFVQVRLPSGNIGFVPVQRNVGFVPVQRNVGFVQVNNPIICVVSQRPIVSPLVRIVPH